MSKAYFGSDNVHSMACKVNALSDNNVLDMMLAEKIVSYRTLKEFVANSSIDHIDCKGKSSMVQVKEWAKRNPNVEFYAKWRADSTYSKDDSVQIYYRVLI
jgi:hypothetical protein